MNYKYMRIMVFFDLPTETSENLRNYRKFRKFLIMNGYIMLQESVYVKLALNKTVVNSCISSLKSNKPPEGDVQVLIITENQFSKIEYIVGERHGDIIDTDERFIEL